MVKGGIAAAIGGSELRRVIIPIFAVMTLGAVAACFAAARF
jgi:hypothetical protein